MLAIWLGWGWDDSQAATFVSPDIGDFSKATFDGQLAVGASVSVTDSSFTTSGNFFTATPELINSAELQFDIAYTLSPSSGNNFNDASAITEVVFFGIEGGVFTDVLRIPFSQMTNRDGSPYSFIQDGQNLLIDRQVDYGNISTGPIIGGRIIIDGDDKLAINSYFGTSGSTKLLSFGFRSSALGGSENALAVNTVAFSNPGAQAKFFDVDASDFSVGLFLTVPVSSGLNAIPEPSSALLLAFGGVSLLKRRQRR